MTSETGACFGKSEKTKGMIEFMNVTIGENIKRLRTVKGLTQEQLSVSLGVSCAAVSKWERGESYPDMELIFPLAHLFGVSTDELLGYDREKIADEIRAITEEYWSLYRKDNSSAVELMRRAHDRYPNEYYFTLRYMYDIIGDAADNDPETLLANREELEKLCAQIIDGCTADSSADSSVDSAGSSAEINRLNAWNIRAKILRAEGKTEEALTIYRTKFVSWYLSAEQKTEQLFAKDTPEFLFYLKKNMYDLVSFAADKLGKSIFFDPAVPDSDTFARMEVCGDALAKAWKETGCAFFAVAAQSVYQSYRYDSDFYRRVAAEDGEELKKRLEEKASAVTEELKALETSDSALAAALEN